MYEIRVKRHFDAAHRLVDYDGVCNREHGHRFDVEVCIQGNALDARNMLVDFKGVKDAMDFIISQDLDHYQLNETLGVDNPTAEYLSMWFFRQMKARLWTVGISDIVVSSVTIWESPECSATYREF